MELLKYVYFCAQKSTIKAGHNKFQDLINAPCKCCNVSCAIFVTGNKLEGDWGEIVALGAEISP